MDRSPYSTSALRRATVHFLTGRLASALLTLAILLVLVRTLTVKHYGYYVTFVALAEIAWQVCDFGLPWAAARYLPQMRLHADGRMLVRRMWQLLGALTAVLALAAALAFAGLPWISGAIGLKDAIDAAGIYLAVLVVEGCGRHARESILVPLMQQAAVRASIVLRHGLFLGGILGLIGTGSVSLRHVVIVELAASLAGTTLALVCLWRHGRARNGQMAVGGWVPPAMGGLWWSALPMYGAQLLGMACSPHLMTVLLQARLGAEAAALFGFLRSLYAYVDRYLPATLMFGLIRPKLVASYIDGGGLAAMSMQANLMGKLSLIVLVPVIAFALVLGEMLVQVLSGGRFPESGWLLGGLMLALLPLSQRRLFETVAVILDRAALCTVAGAVGALALPLVLVLVGLGWGVWSAVCGLICGQFFFAAVMVRGLTRVGFEADTTGWGRMLLAGLATAASIHAVSLLDAPTPLLLGGGVVVALAVALVAMWRLQLLSPVERSMINRLAGRQLLRS